MSERVSDDGLCLQAVRAEVGGRAYYSGTSVFTVEEDDPLGDGFILK